MTEDFDHARPEVASPPTAQPAPEPSAEQAGAALRRAREAKGVHLVALASALKVPTKYLESLEAGRFDALPDLVFAKALASSVCRNINADPIEVLQWWPQVANPTLARSTVSTPIKPMAFDPYPDRPRPWRWVLTLASLLAIVAGLTWLWWMPKPTLDESAAEAVSLSVPSAEAEPMAEPMTTNDDVSAVAKSGVSGIASASDAAATASDVETSVVAVPAEVLARSAASPAAAEVLGAPGQVDGVQPPAQPLTTTPAPATDLNEMSTPSAAPSGQKWLEIQVRKDAWLEVRSPQDGVVLSRVVAGGETVQWPLLGGAWSVVVGNAGGVEVRVNGQVRDLTTDTRANVARFTVE